MGKEMLCFCKKNFAGAPEQIIFKFKGMSVNEFKSGIMCREYAIKLWEEAFKECGSFVEMKNGEIRVDWIKFINCHPDNKDRSVMILESLGVISIEARGNWAIVADDSYSLNPRFFINHYFTKKEYAADYAIIKYGTVQYGWEIHQIADVIRKKELIKKTSE